MRLRPIYNWGHHLACKIREPWDFTSSQMGDVWDVSMRNDTLPAEMVKMWDVYMRHDGKKVDLIK